MNNTGLKRVAALMPALWQQELKRLYFRRQIRRGTFETNEPEFRILDSLVSRGQWAIDIGANVGHYTKRLSDLVGPDGRVIAVEPVPETFALLAANVSLFRFQNVSLLNLAASSQSAVAGIRIPKFDVGLKNYYQAAIAQDSQDLRVVTLALDALQIAHPVSVVKIDVEGHEQHVLEGMQALLKRDHPTLIVETGAATVHSFLARFGYASTIFPASSNVVFRYSANG